MTAWRREPAWKNRSFNIRREAKALPQVSHAKWKSQTRGGADDERAKPPPLPGRIKGCTMRLLSAFENDPFREKVCTS